MMNRTLLLSFFSMMMFIFIFMPIMRLFSYFSLSHHWLFSLISVIIFPLGFQLILSKSTKLTHRISLFATGWFFSVLILVSIIILVELGWFLLRFPVFLTKWLVLGISLVLIIISFITAHLWKVKKINIYSSKIKKKVSFVQISDVHANGAFAKGQLQKVFDKAMKLDPDFIVITGDLVDIPIALNSETFSVLKNIKIPLFYELGNHERYVGLDIIRSATKNSPLTLLENTSKIFGDICIISISDSNDIFQVDKILPTIKKNKSKFQILLYHRPFGYLAAEKEGIDLMLSGHTHAGQIFPISIMVRCIHRYVRNTHKLGKMLFHISAGSGAFMWPLRLGSRNEITLIELNPSS